MKNMLWIVAILSLSASSVAAENPDEWYLKQYAPVWKEKPWDNIATAASHYAETIYLHPVEGDMTATGSLPWLAQIIPAWRSEGWIGSEVTALKSDQINASSVVFKSKWRDFYGDGSEIYSCGWYMADLFDDRWLFTQYAEIDCDEHDL